MCLSNFVKFHHCIFKILNNQNVAAGRTDVRPNAQTDGKRENNIPPQLGGGGWGVRYNKRSSYN